MVGLIRSSADRMAELIEDVLDFARGRLGGGLAMEASAEEPLPPVLEQVVAELRTARPDRVIEVDFDIAESVRCDRVRIGQLLSNLLDNALAHGAKDGPIRVRASTSERTFELSVANPGDPIPPATIEKLFQPFFRPSGRRGRRGLGLGLYIAREIARAHGGTLDVASSPEETRFTFRMPVD